VKGTTYPKMGTGAASLFYPDSAQRKYCQWHPEVGYFCFQVCMSCCSALFNCPLCMCACYGCVCAVSFRI